ncbi:MAG: ATP-binding protein [Candidatus Zhuqueibacterota bacterium]
MSSLRYKLGMGYFILVGIIITTSVFSIYHFSKFGSLIEKILRSNYNGIIAAEGMVIALERQELALLSEFVGNQKESKKAFDKNHFQFLYWYEHAIEGMAQPLEPVFLDSIKISYKLYLQSTDSLYHFIQMEQDFSKAKAYQFAAVRPIVTKLKQQCINLMEVNHNAIVLSNAEAKRTSQEAIIAVIVVSIIAISTSIFTWYQLTRIILRPLDKLTKTIRRIGQGHLHHKIDITTDDEIGELGREFNKMTERLYEYDKINLAQLITEKKKTEAIVASIPEPMVVTSEDNSIVLMNNEAAHILHLKNDEWPGKKINDVVLNEQLKQLLTFNQNQIDETAISENVVHVLDGERTSYYRLCRTKIFDEVSHVQWLVTTLQDVTRFKQLDQMKTEFMATVSHEFRTPLTSINMVIDILLQELLGKLNQQQRDLIASAKNDSERLSKMMKELLDLSKLELGKYKMKISSVNFRELIETAIRPLQLPFQEKGIALEISVDPTLPELAVDQMQITSVIVNLVNNALRYTDTGGRVSIIASLEGDDVQVCVADNGRGIPTESIGSIFDKFVQVKQPADLTPGSVGLGLSIAKERVKMHGGQIWVESKVGRGSQFYFTLPLQRNSEDQSE